MKKPWYEDAFGADYLDRYAHRDQTEADRAAEAFLERARLDRGARVLDLCCGGGRHAEALSQQGVRVTGLDLSWDLLRAAVGRAARTGSHVDFVRGDMRRIPFADGAFDAVVHFFTAFGYFEDDEENLRVLWEVARMLRPGGWYLFDFLNSERLTAELTATPCIRTEETLDDGVTVVSERRLEGGSRRAEKTTRIMREGQTVREIVESVRLFRPWELRPAFWAAGFVIVEQWGGYDARPHGPDSPRWIVLCRRTG